MSLARYKPQYVSLSCRNMGWNTVTNVANYNAITSPDSTINAEVNETYNVPVVDKASNYLVAIERLEVSLNGIPFYNAEDNEQITLQDVAGFNPDITVALLENAFSLSHLLEILNKLIYPNPGDGGFTDLSVVWSLTSDGFVTLEVLETFDVVTFILPRRLQCILGISIAVQPLGNAETKAKSLYPRIDMGDELDHLILKTNLPCFSDTIGNVKTQVLTDFCVPTKYGNSLTYGPAGSVVDASIQTNIRQKAVYVPTERRYLELVGDFPITQLTIACEYVDNIHTRHSIPLPFGGSFEIKIGFYLKS